MGAGHSHSHSHHSHSLQKALIVTLAFAGVEVVGGWLANSLALISDSAHMLTDAGGLGLSLFVTWLSRRRAPSHYTYGLQRVEILGALLNGLIIWWIAGFLIFESWSRFKSPPEVKGPWVFWIATIGLLANLFSLVLLKQSADKNLNIRSAYLHVLTDSLGSVGAMIAGAVISLTGYRLIDPLITVVLSVLMIWSSWRLVEEAVGILLERSPGHVDLSAIEAVLLGIPSVKAIHDLHVWTLSSGSISLSVHLIAEKTETEKILHSAIERLKADFSITHTTIQVEPEHSALAQECAGCE